MEKMRLVYFFYSALLLCFIPNYSSQEQPCYRLKENNGTISESSYTEDRQICWIIEVPEDSFVWIDIKYINFERYHSCSYNQLLIYHDEMKGDHAYKYCGEEAHPKPITAFSDVTINYRFYERGNGRASFELQYFRGVTGDSTSLKYGINWLKKQQNNFGWGRNTHRATTALYLTNAAQFQGNKMEEEVMVKQLQLKMAIVLLRNSTDPMSVNELSMYVNALTVTCHNDRNFFSNNLLKILADRTFSAPSPSPGAYLTLCNAKWSFTSSNVQTLLEHLEKDTEYQFRTEIQAMTVLALSCIKDRTDLLKDYNDTYIFNSTVGDLMAKQREDGSFGNSHTTAIVTQTMTLWTLLMKLVDLIISSFLCTLEIAKTSSILYT